MIQSRNRPKHAFSGVTAGAKHLLTGLTSGLTGIVEKPVEGAKEGGIGGFFKGVGVGLVGIVTKPVVGVLDATTSLTEGIKNTADPDAVDLEQVRLPRAVPYDGVIRPYSAHEARGQSILYAMHLRLHETVTGFRLASWTEAAGGPREFYVAHTAVPHDKAVVLVTSQAVILVEADDFTEIWRVPLGELVHVRPHRDIVLLVTRQEQEATRQRMLFLSDPVEQEWFCARVDDAMAIYNESHRRH
jgi:vacuolar protein sorting-associated protein 13A/C